jgi:PHD/YefM family antitoxin component YafN of YafNO toxin-antitoxin module
LQFDNFSSNFTVSERIATKLILQHMKTQYIIDARGKKTSVILPIGEYEKMKEELEELEEIKAYDRAKTLKSEPIPFEQAQKEIELLRKGQV